MGYLSQNDSALGNGGLGNAGAWDFITSDASDLGGKTVIAFECILPTTGGSFTAMEEETSTKKEWQGEGTSTAVAAKYLTYTYPIQRVFPGRYTKLTPAAGSTFMVWFLK